MKIIYIRTSTEEQNPMNQLDDCKSLIPGEEFKLYEEKQSAWKEKHRDIFEKVIKEISKGGVSDLIVWDLDRIFRNRKKLLGFFQFCKTNKCRILSFRQKWLLDLQSLKLPEGFEWIAEMQINNFLNFLGWIAEEESDKKSSRIKNAVIRAEGKQTESYKGNKWGRKKISAQKIRKIKELKEKGMSIREISDITCIPRSTVHKYTPKNYT